MESIRFENLGIFFNNLRWQDFLDILITAFLIYSLFWFLKRTKSLRAFIAVLILFFFYVFSYWLNLGVTYKILQSLGGGFNDYLNCYISGRDKKVFLSHWFLGEKCKLHLSIY